MLFEEILPYVLIGFAAQLVDGALGMAYGVTASSLLLGLGVPLYLVTMASQNLPGFATLRAAGYEPPVRATPRSCSSERFRLTLQVACTPPWLDTTGRRAIASTSGSPPCRISTSDMSIAPW